MRIVSYQERLNTLLGPAGADRLRRARHHEVFVLRACDQLLSTKISWATLMGVIEAHRLEPPRLRLAHQGTQIAPERYSRRERLRRGGVAHRVRVHDLYSHLRTGAALVLDAVDEIVPVIADAADSLEHEFRDAVQANVYAGMANSHGFGVHWDDHDVLVVQVLGAKRWRVYEPTRPHALHRDLSLPERPQGPPILETDLNAGDVLYIPRGWWHDAETSVSSSIHISLGLSPTTGVDFVAWLGDQLRDVELPRRDVPIIHAALHSYSVEMASLLTQRVTPQALAEFRRFCDVTARIRPRFFLGLFDAHVADAGCWRWLAPRASIDAASEEVLVSADSRRFRFAPPALPILTKLVDCGYYDLQDEVGRSDVNAQGLLIDLARHGLAAPA